MEEWSNLKEEADKAHVTVAALTYYKVINRQSIRIENPEFSNDVRNMLSVSRNLNQIAAACNTLHYLPSDLAVQLNKALDLINKTLQNAYNDEI